MDEYNQVLDIYKKMCEVSDKMHDSFDIDVLGFDAALYTFQYALKKYYPINLSLENKRLQRELDEANKKVLKLKATVTAMLKKID